MGEGGCHQRREGQYCSFLQGLQLARKADPRFQFAWENVGYGALRHDKRLRKALGEGVVVRACAYGRKSGKTYRLWLSSETAEEFSPILPTARESMCQHCKEGRTGPHEQGYCPPRGSKQKRISEEGQIVTAARQRVPWRLSAHVATAMRRAWDKVHKRMQEQA